MTSDTDPSSGREGQLTRRGLLHVGAGLVVTGCASSEGEPPERAGHGPEHAGAHHDLRRRAEVLDDPARDDWQRPREVVVALAVGEGMVVVDVGAGTGYFEVHLSRAVGPRGRVLALEVDPRLVTHMQQRFATAGLANVEARLVGLDDPELGAGTVDRVLVVDTWHHLTDRVAYARRLRQALAPGGLLAVVDYPTDARRGPPQELRLSEQAVLAELGAAGFAARVVAESLPDQYVVLGEVPAGAGR